MLAAASFLYLGITRGLSSMAAVAIVDCLPYRRTTAFFERTGRCWFSMLREYAHYYAS